MAAALQKEFDDINDVELIPGNRGEFTVWVGETLLAQKTYEGFPTPEEVIAALQERRSTA